MSFWLWFRNIGWLKYFLTKIIQRYHAVILWICYVNHNLKIRKKNVLQLLSISGSHKLYSFVTICSGILHFWQQICKKSAFFHVYVHFMGHFISKWVWKQCTVKVFYQNICTTFYQRMESEWSFSTLAKVPTDNDYLLAFVKDMRFFH